MELAQGRVQRRALVLAVSNLRALLPDMLTFALGLVPCSEDDVVDKIVG